MDTFSHVCSDSGNLIGFEVPVVFLRLREVASVLERCDSVSDIRVRGYFIDWEGVHVRFKLDGAECVVYEPFGDNSRYWVGLDDEADDVDIRPVLKVFQAYETTLGTKVLGASSILMFFFSFISFRGMTSGRDVCWESVVVPGVISMFLGAMFVYRKTRK